MLQIYFQGYVLIIPDKISNTEVAKVNSNQGLNLFNPLPFRLAEVENSMQNSEYEHLDLHILW